jgi:hypothetical protein
MLLASTTRNQLRLGLVVCDDGWRRSERIEEERGEEKDGNPLRGRGEDGDR